MNKVEYYTPVDNSFATCIETGKDAYPIGRYKDSNCDSFLEPPLKLIITSKPYLKYVSYLNIRLSFMFIDCMDETTKLHYSVLYDTDY